MSFRVNVPDSVYDAIDDIGGNTAILAYEVARNVRSNGNQAVVDYMAKVNANCWRLRDIKNIASKTLYDRIVSSFEKLAGRSLEGEYEQLSLYNLANILLYKKNDKDVSKVIETSEIDDWIKDCIEVEDLNEKQMSFVRDIVSFVYKERDNGWHDPLEVDFSGWKYSELIESQLDSVKETLDGIIKKYLPDWRFGVSDNHMDVLLAQLGEDAEVEEDPEDDEESVSLDSEVKEAMEHLSEVFQIYGLKLKSIKIKDDFTYTIRTKG